jgi:tripartite-type tricarboxylate transporter receptor subunit TctC
MRNTGRGLLAAAALVATALATPAAAQKDAAAGYPDKPIRFIVPFAAGGANDLTARAIATKLTEKWGQQVVVDNRPGAAGSIGVHLTAQAVPNGYTICLISASHAVSAAVNPKLPYDLTRDLQAITQATSLFYMVTVHPAVPAKSVKELIAHAKANPGKLDYGSSGTFGLQHVAGEMFQHMAGVKLVHVPYKGGAAALAEIVGGRIHMGFNTLLSARPHMNAGRLRALAVTISKRSPAVPELPTVAEAGLPGYEVDQWFGVVTAAKVPPAVVAKLAHAIAEAVRAPDVEKRLSADGSTPVGTTSSAFSAHVQSEVAKWRRLAQDAGLQMQ